MDNTVAKLIKSADAVAAKRDELITRRKAELREALWECSQFMGLGEIRRLCDDVLREIEDDDG